MEHHSPEHVCEQAVYKKLFFDYSKKLRDFLYYKSGNAELSEDLAQEAFLRLWKQCKNVPYSKAKSFLYTVANNLFLDNVKHQKVVMRFQLKKPSMGKPDTPHDLLEEEEFRARLEQAIADMPEKSRTVFLMNRIEKQTYKEIANTLGISVKTVEKRMHKALVELRKISKKI